VRKCNDYNLSSLWDFQLEAKYEVEKEQEARLWIEAVIGESLDEVIHARSIVGAFAFAIAF